MNQIPQGMDERTDCRNQGDQIMIVGLSDNRAVKAKTPAFAVEFANGQREYHLSPSQEALNAWIAEREGQSSGYTITLVESAEELEVTNG